MARSLSDAASTATVQSLANSLTGPATTKTYKVRKAQDIMAESRSFTLMLFGQQSTGKTLVIKDLLLLGLKVLVLDTDFGQGGLNTVYAWFEAHPDEAHRLANLHVVDLDYEGIVQFQRNPLAIMPDLYDLDPDVIFWDGATAYQEADLEAYITKGDVLREDTNWKDWRSTRNGTIFPLMAILAMKNEVTGRPWSKVVTALEKTQSKTRAVSGSRDREDIPGTETTGPMLHTDARTIVGAGFDIALQTKRQVMPDKITYTYVSQGGTLLTKDRFGLPPSMPGDFKEVFLKYIAPKIGWKGETA